VTTLYIRPPAEASADSAPAASLPCQYALAGADGRLLQQGEAALGALAGAIAKARRVLLLVAAADVTLLRLKTPPLSPARLKAALPALVEEQILAEPADCVLAAGPAGADGVRSVAVARRAWLEALVKALLAQGARGIGALPAQLCLPLPAEGATAALRRDGAGLELTLRLGAHEGMGLMLAPSPPAALDALRACAGTAPVTVHLAPALRAALGQCDAPGITLEDEDWRHWIGGAGVAGLGLDLAAALGVPGGQARDWRRWRWPLRLALLALVVNIAGVNLDWLRLKRDADALRASMLQSFKSAYPNETPLLPAAQMRRNIAAAQQAGGTAAADDFSTLAAAFGEALGSLRGNGALASLEYRERALIVKLKPDTLDSAALAQVRAALAARQLQVSEQGPGVLQIRRAGANPGEKS
jgi:general secretion pathway protein L